MSLRIYALIFLAFAAIAAWPAEVYKWVDKDGVVHYTDRPPAESNVQEMEVPEQYPESSPSQADSVYSETIEELNQRKAQRTKEKEADKQARAEAREKEVTSEAYCAKAIHRLNTLKKECPVFYDGAGILRAACPGYVIFYEGERSYIDDDEREQLIKQYSKIVATCREHNG